MWRNEPGEFHASRAATRHRDATPITMKAIIAIRRRPGSQQSGPPCVLARGIAHRPNGPSNSAARKQQSMVRSDMTAAGSL